MVSSILPKNAKKIEAAIFASVSNFVSPSWKLDNQCYHRYTVLTRFFFVSKNETGCRKGQVNVTQFSLPRDKTGRVQTDKYIRLLQKNQVSFCFFVCIIRGLKSKYQPGLFSFQIATTRKSIWCLVLCLQSPSEHFLTER